MLKTILCAMALLLLTGSGAFGSILQGQSWGIGVNNDVQLLHSQQDGQSSQNVLISLSQSTDGPGMVVAHAAVSTSNRPFGGGLIGGGLLGASSLTTRAQVLGLGGIHHGALMFSPVRTMALRHSLGLGLIPTMP